VSGPGAWSRRANVLRWTGVAMIGAVAVTRCAILFVSQRVFDVDPAMSPLPIGGLGPAGSLWLDALLFAACAIALAGEAIAGRGGAVPLLILAIVPLPVVFWHGAGDAGDLWTGTTWAAGALAAATVATLARDPVLRGALIVVLAAGIIPVMARGAANITYEHADNITRFEAQKDEILRSRGWEPGSPDALIFERRIRQPQPIGWFITANIFASVMAWGAIVWLGLGAAALRARMTSGYAGACGLVALACATGLWFTGSKGAVLAALIGGGVLALLAAPRVGRAWGERWGSRLAVVGVLVALGAVVLRGVVLPEGFAGDKSLLFRWHYMVASARIVETHPVAGVGPGGYQAAYMQHRVPRNPEEVASPHSIFWDWQTTLGLAALAWTALAITLLWRAGSGLRPRPGDDEPPRVRGPGFVLTLAATAIGLVIASAIEFHTVDALGLLVRLLGVGGFIAVAFCLRAIVEQGEPPLVRWSLAAGAVTLLVHAQIEMTMTQPGSVVWAWCALGVAGAGGGREAGTATTRSRASLLTAAAAVLAIVGAAYVAVTGARPAAKQERIMVAAAGHLAPFAKARANNTVLPPEKRRDLRLEAATRLKQAWEAYPQNMLPLLAAAEQLEAAHMDAAPEQGIEQLQQAIDLIEPAIAEHNGSALVRAITLHRRLAKLTGNAQHQEEATRLAIELANRDPNGLSTWIRLADVVWEAGDRTTARDAYTRALEIDDAFELDPLKQLSNERRQSIELRIEELK